MEPKVLYEIKISRNQVQLRVSPPEDGRKASLSTIQKDLDRRGVEYRHEVLFEIFRRANNQLEPLARREVMDYEVVMEVPEDKLEAWMTVMPPELGEKKLASEMIREALESAKVVKGILYDEIKRVMRDKVENEKVLVAQGKAFVDGEDGWIELLEDSQQTMAADENTMDYRELNLVKNVFKGDLIARIYPPVPGKNGFNVEGKLLKARVAKRARLKLGRNVRLTEDGMELYAAQDGYVVRGGDRISVENVMDVNNVDSETGNIRFHGVVRVRGQVEDAYTVEAEKGIEVNGAVGRAVLRSNGDIKVGAGCIGATIVCGAGLRAHFLSDCKVKVEGDVIVSDYILHSMVISGGAVRVTAEPKGFITGGRVHAETELFTPIAGAEMSEEKTILEVGSGVDMRKSHEILMERIDANLEVFDKVKRNLNYLQRQRMTEEMDQSKQETFERMVNSGVKLRNELLEQIGKHHKSQRLLAERGEGFGGAILVSEQANAGVIMSLQKMTQTLTESLEGVGYVMVEGTMKVLPYGAALKVHKQEQTKLAKARAAKALV